MGPAIVQAWSDIGDGTVQVLYYYWAFIEAKDSPALLESSQTFQKFISKAREGFLNWD